MSFALYIMNSFFLHQSGNIVGFFLNYAWIYFGGCIVRKYGYEMLKTSTFINSTNGRVAVFISVIIYIGIAFFEIYKIDSWVLSCVVTVMGVLLLFVIAIQMESGGIRKKIWMTLGDYGMDIYMVGYYVQQTIYVVLGKVLEVNYLVYAWSMCVFGVIASIWISKYIVRKNKVLSLLILGG